MIFLNFKVVISKISVSRGARPNLMSKFNMHSEIWIGFHASEIMYLLKFFKNADF